MRIPLVDLKRLPSRQQQAILNKIATVINTGDFILGREVELFEKKFSEYLNTSYCIGVNSGTDGILLSLMALDIKKNDEIILPAFTFSATISPVLMLGAKPVLVDSMPNDPLMDMRKVESSITKKTKAIIPVHLYGAVCDMSEISRISKKNKISVIEDACQAHGSQFKGKKAGTFGSAGVFSFYPGKNLGAYGDAGAVVTNDRSFAEKIKMLRNHGQKFKYTHEYLGVNSRLDSIQAAVLSVKLAYLDKLNKRRCVIAKKYDDGLGDLPIKLIHHSDSVLPNYHLYVISTKERDNLRKFLESRNILCGIHYPLPLHFNPAFKSLGYNRGDFPNAEAFSAECLSIPMFPELTNEEIEYVINSIRIFFNKKF